MAEVFLAEAEDAGSPLKVALKLMREGQDAETFAAEADLMGLLHHPNLVRRLEVGEAFGRLYIAMEALLGGDLKGLVEQLQAEGKRIPPEAALYSVLEVLKGLAFFHQAKTRSGMPLQLVHGDVNPANVFFGLEGEVKLGDFGVATSLRAGIGPDVGVAAGKLRYLSPEQTRGEALTPGSDLFSAGVMLFELLCGQHPFITDELDDELALAAQRSARLGSLDSLQRPLANLLRRALHPNPEQRFQTAGEFAGAVLQFALDQGFAMSGQQMRAWVRGLAGVPG